MYLVSQFTQNVLWILAVSGLFVFGDSVLTCFALGRRSWLLIFSPVSWVSPEALNLVDEMQFLTIPFVVCAFLFLILVLLVNCLGHKDLRMTLNKL